MRPEAEVIAFDRRIDARGALTVGECPSGIPFQPVRFFLVDGVPAGDVRGDHAHRECHQLLICTRGEVDVEVVADGDHTTYALRGPEEGLHVPPLVWARQRYVQADSQLLVLASHPYSVAEYITDFDEYTSLRQP